MKLAPRHHKILELLKGGGSFTNRQISERLKANYVQVARDTSYLTSHKLLSKIPAPGNQFKYFMDDGNNEVKQQEVLDLSQQDIEKLLVKWSTEKWNPKIFNSARNLPLTLARLLELAVDINYGSVVETSELEDQKLNLIEFKKDLEQTLRVVVSVIQKEELWKPTKLPSGILSVSNPEYYKTLAQKLKDIN